jgi:hypothetical protein
MSEVSLHLQLDASTRSFSNPCLLRGQRLDLLFAMRQGPSQDIALRRLGDEAGRPYRQMHQTLVFGFESNRRCISISKALRCETKEAAQKALGLPLR